jgi:O-antigen/teichoic acid export membrane protein
MSLRQKVFSGFFWVAVSSVSIQAIGFISSAVLARLLMPHDFGLVRIALIFVSLSNIFGEFGFGQALIQWSGDVHEAADTGVFLNTALSLVLALALFMLAPAVAAFYHAIEVTWVLRALALNIVLFGLGVVPGSLLERELEFRRKTLAEVLPQICYGLVAIGLALFGVGVWSLIIGLIASTLLRTALFWQRSNFRSSFRFDRPTARRLVSFGKYLVLISLLLFATRNLDTVYLGRITNPTQVGFYGMAMTITNLAVDSVVSPFGRVTFPAFSRLQEEISQVSRAYLRAMNCIAYAALPIIFGIFAVAPAAVIGIYGAKWAPVVTLTRILCLFALFRTLARLTGGVFTATGRPEVTTKIAILRLTIFGLLLLVLGSTWHTEGVAWATALSMMVAGLWSIWLTNRHLAIRHRRFISTIGPQLVAAALMCAGVSLVSLFLPTSLVSLALLVALGVVLYAGLLFAFGGRAVRRDINDILTLLRERQQATTNG